MNNLPSYEAIFDRNYGVLTLEEQEKLRKARVTVVGVGGVGGITAIQCVRMGIENLHIIDGDLFVPSNLNRQMLSFVGNLGRSKAEEAERILKDINPRVKIKITTDFITKENAEDLLSQTDVILDGTDNLAFRVIVHRAAYKLGIPSVWIAVTPPFRGGVMCLSPTSVPYEKALKHLSLGKELTDELEKQVIAIKDERAKFSVSKGALADWADKYLRGEKAWAVISPVANIVGLLASFEIMKLVIRRPDLEPVYSPQLLHVDMASNPMVSIQTSSDGSWDYTKL
ncbi:MAG: ThiF family adenylyltransferase [Nitrospirae bacterium]|nr:ThiF family adenylyltransferase [Nitrospirota bacterium]MCL5977231.1 ThiF family adenylyltransferase [Nitrospirota bacterium]